jgi:two-component system cell cycle sensor histidine kinase/response regulator CckA
MSLDDEGLLRSLIDQAPFPVALRDLEGRVQLVNRRSAAIVGRSSEELLQSTPGDVFDAATAAALEELEARVLASGEVASTEVHGTLPEGHCDYLVTRYPVRDDQGAMVGVGGISIDITERKRVENRLREAEDRFRGAFDSAAVGMALVGDDGSFLAVNRALCAIVGYSEEELLQRTFQQITHPDDVDGDVALVRQVLEGEIQSYQLDKRYIRKDSEQVWVRLSVSLVRDAEGKPVHFVAQIKDIGEQRRAEELAEQLRHSQKLDAVGRLAGGVAHDFNNMLTAIQGYSRLLLDGLEPHSPLRQHAEQISRAADQASTLPRQLLAFSRKQAAQPEVIDVHEVLAETGNMVGHLLGERIELVIEPGPQTAHVLADAGRVEQVVLNLAVNAGEAMPEGGVVRVSTRDDYLARADAGEFDVAPGPYVVLSVADTGEGMDADTKAKAFEPFFTTKPTGSGLGLSTVYGIVRQGGGFLRVQSEPGHGSVFEVWLPRSQVAATPGAPGESTEEESQALPLTVLVAEDEEIVRGLAVTILERAGYRVLAAADGEQALELSRATPGPVDALLADMVMPGMSGRELAARVLQERPGTRAVLMSGYTEEATRLGGDAAAQPLFLEKPFTPSALVEILGEALSESFPAPASDPCGAREAIGCLVADDHPAVLDSVSRYLCANGFDVIAQTERGDDALAQIELARPAVALLDVRMTALSGVEVARRAAVSAPETRIVLFTGYSDRALLAQALSAGARGFVSKEAPLEELVRALTIVADGGTYVDPALAGSVADAGVEGGLAPLTAREQQILALAADGMTNDKAASELGISAETVQSHMRNAMAKLHADTRTQAVATAMRHALLT